MNHNLSITPRWKVGAVSVLSLAMVAVAMGACFSERATTDATSSTGTCSAPANTAGSTVVFITAFTFQPATVHVKAGSTVAWVNCEPTAITHTSTSDGAGWESGAIAPTKDYVHTFAGAGTFPYHCAIHPSMKATIIVD